MIFDVQVDNMFFFCGATRPNEAVARAQQLLAQQTHTPNWENYPHRNLKDKIKPTSNIYQATNESTIKNSFS